MDSRGLVIKEVKSELNRLCIDNEDPKMKFEERCHHSRDDPVDQRSKFILPKLVKKIEEEFAFEGEFSCIDAVMGMEGEFGCIDSEMVEVMKFFDENEKTIDNEIKQLEKAINNEEMKVMKNSSEKKGIKEKKDNYFSFNKLFILCMLLFGLIV
ncbi:hypothetical protein K7X08_025036 [Anisodus acutangulus]|uniref:Uncharacterized protein n=1 Tax=Anisodus acutangulus TaxID=402998 RepID=A0A9Q1MA00_9SOLA|nr:hypothetical protein K7X08_025036 [Anisodus acutangulus]